MYEFTEAEVVEALYLEEKAISPGGRPADDSSLDRSPKQNWVEKRGGLPRYVRMVANALVRQGKSRSAAIGMAIGVIRNWAQGKSNVRPQVRAAAAAAIAQWEAMKGSKSAEAALQETWNEKDAQQMLEQLVDEHNQALEEKVMQGFEDQFSLEMKHANGPDGIEYKSVSVAGVQVEDEGDGVISTYVSVTNLVDGVNDVIHEGAYEKSLKTRTPKGIWSHDWNIPVAKTLESKELKPGDPLLPDTLPNKKPWPKDAGALLIKTQFNLETQRGREAYSDVTFFGSEQEWSIGYQVPPGGATIDKKTGQRHIHTLNLYEYSPVLFGAMPAARTKMSRKNLVDNFAGVPDEEMSEIKAAQFQNAAISMDLNRFVEWKAALFDGGGAEFEIEIKSAAPGSQADNIDDEAPDGAEDADAVDEDEIEQKAAAFDHDDDEPTGDDGDDWGDDEPRGVRKGRSGRGKRPREGAVVPLVEVVEGLNLPKEHASLMKGLAEDFDLGVDDGDDQFRDEAGDEILATIEDSKDEVDDDVRDAFVEIANAILAMLPDDEGTDADVVQTTKPKPVTPAAAPVEKKSISMSLDEYEAFKREMLA